MEHESDSDLETLEHSEIANIISRRESQIVRPDSSKLELQKKQSRILSSRQQNNQDVILNSSDMGQQDQNKTLNSSDMGQQDQNKTLNSSDMGQQDQNKT